MIKERKFNQEPGALIQARLHPSLLSPSLPSAPTPTGLCSLRGVASPGRCLGDSFPVADVFSGGLLRVRPTLEPGAELLAFALLKPWCSLLAKWGLEEHSLEAMARRPRSPSALAAHMLSTASGSGSRVSWEDRAPSSQNLSLVT